MFLPLLGLLLVAGRGTTASTPAQQYVARILNIIPAYPGSFATSKSYPHPPIMLPKEHLVTASSKYLMPATVPEIENWYLHHFISIGWTETGSVSSGNAKTGTGSSYEIEFTSPKYPLIFYQLSLESLSQSKTLAQVVVADAQTPRPTSSYLSTSFDRAKVTIYSVATTMVPKQSSMYPFLLKKTNKNVVRSYAVTNAVVVHQWVKMLDAMEVAPKMGAVDCPAIGPSTTVGVVVFSSSDSPGEKTVTVPVNCQGLPGIGSVVLWDPTSKFWRIITSYPQVP
ncbi:MAG: hypothetical protein EPN30_00365 [Actinomycetota bacterium]|nr:MAG: hypothetical protein EPN30_00365 [Actinomycetota bacterium]